MANVAQLVRAPGCGSGGRGFNSHHSPQILNLLKEIHMDLFFMFLEDVDRDDPYCTLGEVLEVDLL